MLELVERFAAEPLADVEVLAVATGCEESGMGGMAAFLRARARSTRRRRFVLGLDTLGAGDADRARRARARCSRTATATDRALDAERRRLPCRALAHRRLDRPVLALFAGLPAVSLLSIGPKGVVHELPPADGPARARRLRLRASAASDIARETVRA